MGSNPTRQISLVDLRQWLGQLVALTSTILNGGTRQTIGQFRHNTRRFFIRTTQTVGFSLHNTHIIRQLTSTRTLLRLFFIRHHTLRPHQNLIIVRRRQRVRQLGIFLHDILLRAARQRIRILTHRYNTKRIRRTSLGHLSQTIRVRLKMVAHLLLFRNSLVIFRLLFRQVTPNFFLLRPNRLFLVGDSLHDNFISQTQTQGRLPNTITDLRSRQIRQHLTSFNNY